jgi:hypothetical protein
MWNLKKLNDVNIEGNEKYRVEISNRFACWKNLNYSNLHFNKAWEIIRVNIKISAKETLIYYELKKHKPWFDETKSLCLTN